MAQSQLDEHRKSVTISVTERLHNPVQNPNRIWHIKLLKLQRSRNTTTVKMNERR
jgi:hypothetical protein